MDADFVVSQRNNLQPCQQFSVAGIRPRDGGSRGCEEVDRRASVLTVARSGRDGKLFVNRLAQRNRSCGANADSYNSGRLPQSGPQLVLGCRLRRRFGQAGVGDKSSCNTKIS